MITHIDDPTIEFALLYIFLSAPRRTSSIGHIWFLDLDIIWWCAAFSTNLHNLMAAHKHKWALQGTVLLSVLQDWFTLVPKISQRHPRQPDRNPIQQGAVPTAVYRNITKARGPNHASHHSPAQRLTIVGRLSTMYHLVNTVGLLWQQILSFMWYPSNPQNYAVWYFAESLSTALQLPLAPSSQF